MGRRDAENAGRVENAKRIDYVSAKAWEAVRRTLGRLVSQVAVRDCGPSERAIDVSVVTSDALSPLRVPLGRANWQPSATVRLAAVPSAGTGLHESDLMPSAALAEGDYALAPSDVRAMPVVHAEAGHIESAGLVWPFESVRLPDEFLRLPTEPVRINTVVLPARSGTKRLAEWSLEKPSVRAMRLPPLYSPRIRLGGDSVMSRIAVTRYAQGVSVGQVFTAEQRRLAEASNLPPDDVALLGVYPGVPILAVSRILIEGEGRLLRLWLKPEVLRSRATQHLITLLVGRQSSTGKMLQAAL